MTWHLAESKLSEDSLASQVVILTGAAGGIGSAIARVLHSRGTRLIVADFDEGGLSKLASSIDPTGQQVVPVTYDANNPADADSVVSTCLARFGQVDHLVPAAAIFEDQPFATMSDSQWRMAELMGKEGGICKGRGGSMHLADRSVGIISESGIVGGGLPLATGCAFSAKVRGLDQVSLCFFGDGAVNQGTFHESLNMASLWKLPVIYLCENNGYAVTVSVSQTHGQPDIALRAAGFGMPGVKVDGQDLDAVFEATEMAVKRARAGIGPTLIVAGTYRFDEHNAGLAIPGEPYRSTEEIESYKRNRDPIVLYHSALLKRGVSEERLRGIDLGVIEAIKEAVQFGFDSPLPQIETLSDCMFNSPLIGHNNFIAGLERK
ncbi:MAG: SDR family NAD(P)-dependent oxidoreductase [Mesorhizobium sp.]|uniref:SDR family NAD(P)-dependent oxidoreductase n=1 Tax=Mesorhizobium sp. TaxID=1871066 RepID=UPI000FEA9253|nr:SDR family NAD(P)-dependent oxidoreductase [Mesorhizobium sp.]RWE20481.1 MAG: SDR family NAD(P)-dependent oxidoreductase [Mesorhizobium sp.]